jgi:adenylosuccinate lyase
MVIDEAASARNMDIYGPFAATERVLMAVVAAGGSRQDGHEWIREASLQAWAAMRQGNENPLLQILAADSRILEYLTEAEVIELMDAREHTGTAVARAQEFAQLIRETIVD